MENSLIAQSDDNHQLSIFVTETDRTTMDIRAMSDFMSNRISNLTLDLIRYTQSPVALGIQTTVDLAWIAQTLMSGRPTIHGEYEYLLDFDSLPKDILEKLRKGEYSLGSSRQVENNLRAVIVDKNGTRVKDLTLKQGRRTAVTANTMQSIAIQAQLKQIDAKLDAILEMQGYQIDFARNTELVAPFFNARDRVVHAQNEPDPTYRRAYLDDAIKMIEKAMNTAYLDIETIQKELLSTTERPLFSEKKVNRCIGYIAQDLQLLARYNGVLLQILDFMGKKKDKVDAFEKYRTYMLGFYTEAVGRKQLPLALQIHNVFDASQALDKNVWKTMTDEIVPMLKNSAEVQDALIISMEEEKQ